MRMINADLIWLLPLALIPVLIHILIRRRLPRTPWAAMTFLLRALRKNRRRLLLETILLLIVRTVIVLAIALVVLRPVAKAGFHWLIGQRQRTVSVIVLDDSASMAASDGIRTRLDRAVIRIEQYLDDLPSGSEVAVILASDPPKDLIRQPTRDIGYVRQSLLKLSARDGTAAISEALDRVTGRLSEELAPNREIIVVTDAQASNWQRDRTKLTTAFAEAARQAGVFMLTVSETSPCNVAVEDLVISGGPNGLIPSLATTLWPTTIRAKLATFHHREPVETAVELFVDGRKVARRQVTLPPDRRSILEFEHTFSTPGRHVVAARCESDLFERDNERTIVVEATEHIGALLVDGQPADERVESATGFLQVALWPMTPNDAENTSLFDTRVVSVGGLESVRISEYPLIVLADVPALSMGALGRIRSAVRDGAGLLVIAGPQVTGPNLSAMFSQEGNGLLPIALARPIDLAPDADPIGLTLTSPVVPALVGFEDPTLAKALSQAGWRTLRPVAALEGKNTQTWATFARGGAALVANTYGRGSVVYFGGTVDRRGGEFPLSPAFVPFVQQLAFYLVRSQSIDAVVAGEALDWPAPKTETTVVYPDGSSESADIFRTDDATTGQPRIVLPAAERSGVYTLRFSGATGMPEQLRRAANVPVSELDTAMLTEAELGKDDALKTARLVGPEEPMRAALHSARTEAELSGTGIVVLLALLAIELLLVKLFSPKPVDTEALLSKAMKL